MTFLQDFAAGETVTDDPLNDVLDALPFFQYKSADQPENSNSTLFTDDELWFAEIPAGTYLLECMIVFAAAATPDLKFSWIAAGATMTNWTARWRTHDGTEVSGVQSTLTTVRTIVSTAGAPPDQSVISRGVLIIPTATLVGLQWAQNTSNIADTTLRANSWLMLQRMA